MSRWVYVFAASLVVGLLLVLFHHAKDIEPFRISFLAIAFAAATFSVSFSMAAFNASTYRRFHRGFPSRLLWACMVFLLVALTPVAALVVNPSSFIATSLFLLPSLAVGGALLLEIARRETDPVTLVERLCSLKKVTKHLRSLVPVLDAKIAETKALELSRPEDRPTHEFDWHLPLPLHRDEPLNHLATLGLLAIEHGDLYSFKRVLARSIEALDWAENFTPDEIPIGRYRVRQELRSHVFEAIQRMSLGLQQNKGTVSLARVAVDTLAEFAVTKSKGHKQTQDITFSALYLMETLARHCYESGSTSEIRIPLIVARQLVQKGIDQPPACQDDEDAPVEIFEFHHALPQLTTCIKRLGSFAVGKHDTEFLYRCFDAFGWLGCAAVKQRHITTATACLRAIAQLGREARAERLECFWSRCPVRPEDHAVERVDWIAGWVAQIPEDEREHWNRLSECAYGRLTGKQTTLVYSPGSDGKTSVERHISNEKYTESYMMLAAARDVDYSDFTFLKDLELLAFRGVLAQGPVVPLSISTG
jgi:hypothetical protein